MKLRGYILVTEFGTPFEDQVKAVRSFTNLAFDLFTDSFTDSYHPRRLSWATLLSQSVRGDAVVVGSPGALGNSAAEIEESMNTLRDRGLLLQDARTGHLIVWDASVIRALTFYRDAVGEVRRRSAEAARVALAATRRKGAGVRTGAAVSKSLESKWRDPINHPSIGELIRESGLSRRSLYRRFGSRGLRA